MAQHRLRGAVARERGTALLVVSFVLIIVLVGGLAAVAVTSGELSSSRGFRTRQVTRTCAEAGLEHVRALPEGVTQVSGPLGNNLTYRTGHYGATAAQDTLNELDSSSFDVNAVGEGENITNLLDVPVKLVAATVTCSGSGYGEREMELIFSYGTAMEAR